MIVEKKSPVLDGRLSAAAAYVRQGGVVCDVGTDHAYIPIWLLLQGICPRAVASDIHHGPLERARIHAESYGVSDRIVFYISDGLDAVEPETHGVTDICICGMGGELTASILERSAYTRLEGVQLILQPMSSAYELRQFCTQKGYRIQDETLCEANRIVYSCLSVYYTGVAETYTEAELLLGRHTLQKNSPLLGKYVKRHLSALEKRIRGRQAGGLDIAYETALHKELHHILQGI